MSQNSTSQNNGNSNSLRLKTGLAEMLKGGVIMDVTNAEQAVIAEKAGAVSVMALERVPAQIRAEGGVARMASPKKIREIMAAVSIPVMAKCRIGHFAEAQILQELAVDYIDESEVLTPADEAHHVDKHAFNVPFVCGARNLGEALRRIAEGAAMIRTKGEAGTGDVVHAVKHMRQIVQEMKILTVLSEEELYAKAKEHQAPYELVRIVAKEGKLPVPNFSAGGIATPADASLVMQLGAEAVFVGSGIFMGKRTSCVQCEDGKHSYDDSCAFAPPEQLDPIDVLVIAGGESSTFLKLLGEAGFEKLKQFVRVRPTFGTCAGAILLAHEVENPKQIGLGALNIAIRRNAYGRQIDSSIREGNFLGQPTEMVFIRAPKIESVGPGVEV